MGGVGCSPAALITAGTTARVDREEGGIFLGMGMELLSNPETNLERVRLGVVELVGEGGEEAVAYSRSTHQPSPGGLRRSNLIQSGFREPLRLRTYHFQLL